MDLQFENVQLGFESRPRTGSLCFHVTLGAVSLHDHFTVNSAFPVLISPQSKCCVLMYMYVYIVFFFFNHHWFIVTY